MLHSGRGSIPHILAPMVCLCESTTHEDGAIMHDDTLVVASNFASGVQLLQHELSVSGVYAAVYIRLLADPRPGVGRMGLTWEQGAGAG